MYLIDIDNLTKDYGMGKGVFDVSLKVSRGEVYGFLGPNGAGKSTTIRHLMGFSKPDRGYTKVNGLESFKNYSKILENVGYLPGEIALPAGLNCKQFLKMMKDLRHMKSDSYTQYLIDRFSFDATGDTKELSLGQKRKLAIIAAFMHDPDILILDEPTSGLDPIMQEVFIQYIIEQKKRGKTILMSSHIFSEVDATCDKIAIIKDGRIVDRFVAADLKHNQTKDYTVRLDSSESLDSFCALPFISIVNTDRNRLMVRFTVDEKNTNALFNTFSTLEISDFTENTVTLQDYFMKFYKEDIVFEGVR